MPNLVLILLAVLLLSLGCGAVIWLVFRHQRPDQGKGAVPEGATRLTFRWHYIALPLITLLLAAVTTAVFYPQLPAEVTYQFQADSPPVYLSRGAIAVWALLPQFCLVVLAGATVWGAARLFNLIPQTEGGLNPKGILALMGNIIGLPQLIISFAILDVFRYNLSGTHIMPVWIFALIVMGVGGIVLSVFFFLAIRRVWRADRQHGTK